MSHIAELKALKDQCDASGDCSPYYVRLSAEDAQIDSHTAEANISITAVGVFAVLIALTILFTAFVRPLRRVVSIVMPWLLASFAIIIGVGAGFFGGFLIAFGACFKQSCSVIEEYMALILPALSLLATIPLGVFLTRKRKTIERTVYNTMPQVWAVVGIIALTLIALVVAAAYVDNAQENKHQKYVLRTYVNE